MSSSEEQVLQVCKHLVQTSEMMGNCKGNNLCCNLSFLKDSCRLASDFPVVCSVVEISFALIRSLLE